MATLTPHDPAEEARAIPLGDVEAELTRRIRALQEPGETALMRIHMSNLVVCCDDPARADRITEAVPDLAAVHPARVFLLVLSREPAPLTATVAVRERRTEPGRTAASELITLRAGGPELQRLPFAVRSLVLGNLPTNLFWASTVPPSTAGPLLEALAEGAEQVLYDSRDWSDTAGTLAAVASWRANFERIPGPGRPGWRLVADLNWNRLGTWRSLLAQALDPASAPGALESITAVEIDHEPRSGAQGWLLAGWLVSRLGWSLQDGTSAPDGAASWNLRAPQGPVRLRIAPIANCPTDGLQGVQIACTLDGQDHTLVFAPEDGCRLSVCHDAPGCVPRTVTLVTEPLPLLVGRQLSDREPDPIFRDSLTTAGTLARALDR